MRYESFIGVRIMMCKHHPFGLLCSMGIQLKSNLHQSLFLIVSFNKSKPTHASGNRHGAFRQVCERKQMSSVVVSIVYGLHGPVDLFN